MIATDLLNHELQFTFSRSSGPGGQNVNKVNTKVTLRFSIVDSHLLDEEQKVLLINKLENRINKDGDLVIISQSTRSQLQNREETIQKFYDLLNEALRKKKKRKPTKPTRSSKEKRLKDKKIQSEKKTFRGLQI